MARSSLLLETHRFLRKGPPNAEGWSQLVAKDRNWERSYRGRWAHDKVVRSTHGVNCTGSCSWNVHVGEVLTMGLFGGGKPEVTVELERDELVAGEPVRVRATFGAPDKKSQGARLELLYRNTFKEDDTDSDGHSRTVTRTKDVVVATQQIALPSSGLATPVEAELLVPADAPGTAPDVVEWQVRAVVDRKLGRDAREALPVRVLSGADALAAWAQPAPESSVAWPIELAGAARVARAGDTITGELRFTPGETVKAAGVRVQLRRERKDPDLNTEHRDEVVVELAGKGELPAGTPQALPFRITVPATASPSFRARHNEQHWYLQGVIDVSRARDPRVSAEIVVHTG